MKTDHGVDQTCLIVICPVCTSFPAEQTILDINTTCFIPKNKQMNGQSNWFKPCHLLSIYSTIKD